MTADLANLAASLVRTTTPIVAGVAGSIAASPYLDPFLTERAIAATLAVVYYALARLLERRLPAFGWLLGVPIQPVYTSPEPAGEPASPHR